MLQKKPRDFALFVTGINTALRASDMLAMTAGQVRYLGAGESFELRERKTKKLRRITLNRAALDALNNLIRVKKLNDSDLLFQGRIPGQALSTSVCSQLVKLWCRKIGLKGNYASHSLRKTFGFHQRKTFGVSIPLLMTIFNHSNQKQTLAYLGIQAEEITHVFNNEI